jgi:RNA polymerase sigma-70 factor (ECF subfamily)
MSEQEFNTLVISLINKLLSVCYGILGDREEAKDALQEVYIKLWKDKEKLLAVNSIEAFARSVTRNHCIDVLRTKKKMQAIDPQYLSFRDNDYIVNEDLINQQVRLVKSAMVNLNEIQQQVFTMRDIEGMEFDAISEVLGITSENARVTLSRARKSIREFVSKAIIKQNS